MEFYALPIIDVGRLIVTSFCKIAIFRVIRYGILCSNRSLSVADVAIGISNDFFTFVQAFLNCPGCRVHCSVGNDTIAHSKGDSLEILQSDRIVCKTSHNSQLASAVYSAASTVTQWVCNICHLEIEAGLRLAHCSFSITGTDGTVPVQKCTNLGHLGWRSLSRGISNESLP